MNKLLFILLLSVLLISCGEEEFSKGPDWGELPTQPDTPSTPGQGEDDKAEVYEQFITPTTELAATNSSFAGLRFEPGISINIASNSFANQLASIATAGFKYIEITIKHSYGIKDMTDEQVKAKFAERLNQVKSAGLTIWSIHLPFEDENWTNVAGKEAIRVQSVNNIMRVLRLCVEGFPECKNYVLHASKGVLSPRSESVLQARKSLNEMIPLSKQLGVRICVENLVGSLCYSIEEMENTIQGIDGAWVTYDIGHANCVGIDVVTFLEKIGPRLGTVHMHDTKFGSKNDSHDLLGDPSLGNGCIKQWEDVYRTMLEDNRYRGVFMFELTGKNPNTVMASYKKMIADYRAKYEPNVIVKE